MSTTSQILSKNKLEKDDIIFLLSLKKEDSKELFDKSSEVKQKFVGNKVYYRGLIEFSNICKKDCYYCGIRRSNKNVSRYELGKKQILEAAQYSYENNFGSIVLQSGERTDNNFIDKITDILKEIKKLSQGKLGVTLSLGEQSQEVYKQWFDAGAHRYLLRIEESNKNLYNKLHPNNELHSFENRLNVLKILQKTGYQTGTGVMIGLPFQTVENLADNLIFFRDFDIDMIGMGPYIEHEETPLFKYRNTLWALQERFFMSMKMIAILRLIMPDINIAATTALQSIDPIGRERAIRIGANVLMPNVTPAIVRKNYLLYKNKPCTDENADDCLGCLETRLKLVNAEFAKNQWGDSKHFFNRTNKTQNHNNQANIQKQT